MTFQIPGLDPNKVVVVAEVGNNHEGDFGRAKEMVHQAAASGADVVKFQTFKTKWFTAPIDPARIKRLEGFELTYDQFAELATLAKSLGLKFMSTPLDLESARFLATICDAIKIASGDNDYWELLQIAAVSKLPLIVSSGMTDLPALKKTVGFVREAGAFDRLAVLHCVSAYPAPDDQINLRALPLLARELGCTVGYSDHTLGSEACLAAVALGARVVEKHFTLRKDLSDFRDHQLSADPPQMKELVRQVRVIEALLGSEAKEIQAAEQPIAAVARRSATAARDLPQGHRVAQADLVFLRPGAGVRPGDEGVLVGRTLRRAVTFGTQLGKDDVQ